MGSGQERGHRERIYSSTHPTLLGCSLKNGPCIQAGQPYTAMLKTTGLGPADGTQGRHRLLVSEEGDPALASQETWI